MVLKINGKIPDWWLLEEPTFTESLIENVHVYALLDYDHSYKLFGPVVEKVFNGFVSEYHNLMEAMQCFPCG